MDLSGSEVIGFLASGTIIGLFMSYLAKRKGWNEWRWLLAGWLSGAILGAVVGGFVMCVIFYMVRAYEKGKTVRNG